MWRRPAQDWRTQKWLFWDAPARCEASRRVAASPITQATPPTDRHLRAASAWGILARRNVYPSDIPAFPHHGGPDRIAAVRRPAGLPGAEYDGAAAATRCRAAAATRRGVPAAAGGRRQELLPRHMPLRVPQDCRLRDVTEVLLCGALPMRHAPPPRISARFTVRPADRAAARAISDRLAAAP